MSATEVDPKLRDAIHSIAGDDHEHEADYLLLSERYNEMRPTIITTNLSLNQIADRIDARVASRLVDGLVIKLDLPDYRRAAQGRG